MDCFFLSEVNFISIGPCDNVQCDSLSECKKKADGGAECICSPCDAKEYQPVCGDDGTTYASECFVGYEVCSKKKLIKVIKEESCGMN